MTTKISPFEGLFIKQLNYWIKRGTYGIEHEGSIWIYNTLEDWAKQLGISKRSVQRAIKSLRDAGIVKAAFLSPNKRNRTLFYTIDYDKFDNNIFQKRGKINSANDVVQSSEKNDNKDHLVGHMYIINNNIINKSYKSEPIFDEKIDEINQKPKNTTVQDMVKALTTEFPNIPIFMTKALAKRLVAAFKFKFKNSLEKWKEFLKLIKTSAYLMSEKFHLTIYWILKFTTIDRLFQGDLGVKLKEIFLSKTKEEELEIQQQEIAKTSELKKQINELDETEKCKETRSQILQKVGNTKYETWFKKVFFSEENGCIIMNIPTQNNFFLYDYITNHFRDMLDNMNLFCKSTNVARGI